MDADVPFIGQIVPTAANFPPEYWALCNGQLLHIAQYQALYSLLGIAYGGSLQQGTFGLPDLRGRVGCGYGAAVVGLPSSVGQTAGQTAVQLTASNLPSHGHGVALTLSVGVDYTTGNGGTNIPPVGGLLASAILAGTTTTVDVYAPVGTSSPISATLPVTLTGTPTITADVAGGTTPVSVMQPTVGMYMCIALVGEYPVNE